MKRSIRSILCFAILAMVLLVHPAAAKELPPQLPDPDDKAPDTSKPVQVYTLAGNSF